MKSLALDIRASLRALGRSRAYAIGVVMALSLTLAGTAMVFAVVNAVVLQPLPYEDPDRLVWIWATRTDRDKAFFSIPDFLDSQRSSTTLDGVAAYSVWGVNLTGGTVPERVQGSKVTANAFTVLGVRAALGRTLLAADEAAQANRVVVITDGMWRRRFAGAATAIGSRILLNGQSHEVVGVLPKDFLFPNLDAELFIPLAPERDPRRTARGSNFLRAFGRLRQDASLADVREEWGRIARDLRAAYPVDNAKKTEPRVLALDDEMLGPHRPALAVLMGAVLAVWLLACVNILSLHLIRLGRREKDAAIRAAIGATRMDVARLELIESLVLVGAGVAIGACLAQVGVRSVVAAVPSTLPRASAIGLDPALATFMGLVAAITFFVVAVLPLARPGVGRGRPRALRLQHGLVAVEIGAALCLFLVTSFSLMAYTQLRAVDPGFALDGLTQTRLSLPAARYGTNASVETFLERAKHELLRIPGVTHVAMSNALPLAALNNRTDFDIVGAPAATADQAPGAQNRWVTTDYFATVGMPALEGRTFTDADAVSRAPVVVIDRPLAQRFWPGRSAVGSRIRLLDGTPEGIVLDVIGVVGSVPHFEIDEAPLGTLYAPVHQIPRPLLGFFGGSVGVAVKGAAEGGPTNQAIVNAIRRVDTDVPTTPPWTMKEQIERVLAPRRFVAVILAVFAAAALLLAVSGVYAVVSAAAREQARELTIRLALGAPRGALLRLVLGLAVRLVSAGLVVGLAFATAAARAATQAGFAIDDWRLWTMAPTVLTLAALGASYLTARRVLRLDPAVALRGE